MTFQQLEYLLEVSRTGSISGAAKNLFLAQSSVSAAISNLEEELGFAVFIRTKKGVIPTLQGAEVIEQATRICESYRAMTRSEGSEKKHVRISAPAAEALDEAFAELVSIYRTDESVFFTADNFPTLDAVKKLSSMELDVAVLLNHKARFLSVETLLRSRNFSWETVAELPVVIQIGRGHPLYEKEFVEPRDLEGMLFVDNINDPLVCNEYLKGVIRLSPERTVSVKSAYAASLLVAKGVCFSIGVGSPRSVSEAMGLRSIPLKDVFYTVTVVLAENMREDEAVNTYVRVVKKKLEDYGKRR